MPVDALIRELLATGQMNEETATDLARWLADFTAGKLDPDDEAYVRALHAKLTGAPMPEAEPAESAGPVQLDGHTAEEWRDRALRAEAELAALRDQPTAP